MILTFRIFNILNFIFVIKKLCNNEFCKPPNMQFHLFFFYHDYFIFFCKFKILSNCYEETVIQEINIVTYPNNAIRQIMNPLNFNLS